MFSFFGPDNMKYFQYATFITLYDIDSTVSNGRDWIWKMCLLAGIAVVTFLAGTITFTKRDFPL